EVFNVPVASLSRSKTLRNPGLPALGPRLHRVWYAKRHAGNPYLAEERFCGSRRGPAWRLSDVYLVARRSGPPDSRYNFRREPPSLGRLSWCARLLPRHLWLRWSEI